MVLAAWLLHTSSPWSIAGANLVAAVTLTLLFHRHHRAPSEILTSAE
jgi:hypothetical protein